MPRHKGSIGLILVALVLVLGMAIFIGLRFSTMTQAVKIRTTFLVNMQVEDKGSEMLAFLNSKTGDVTYMELLGNLVASNRDVKADEKLRETLEKLKMQMGYSGYNLAVHYLGKMMKYGKPAPEDVTRADAEIPIPGAREGLVKAIARFVKWQ